MSDISVFTKEKRLAKPVPGSADLLCEVVSINPGTAARWLKANEHNRPLNAGHVSFLAREMLTGHWVLNGQAMIIAEDESVLDGQHRLHAIIESGCTIKSLVIYGIPADAFRTIDTGKVRSGQDVLCLHFPDAPRQLASAAATGCRWLVLFERKAWTSKVKTSNTDILAYVLAHPEVWRFGEILKDFPKEQRPMAIGPLIALYALFYAVNGDAADLFMKRLCTGEELKSTDAEYIVRALFVKDQQRLNARYTGPVKMKMIVKAWNLARSGKKARSQGIVAHLRDPLWIEPK